VVAGARARLQQKRGLAARDGVQLGRGVIRDGEELVHATQEEAPLLVRVAEQRELRGEQHPTRGRRRAFDRACEGLMVVVRDALELREQRRGRALVHVEQQRSGGWQGRASRCGGGRREGRLLESRAAGLIGGRCALKGPQQQVVVLMEQLLHLRLVGVAQQQGMQQAEVVGVGGPDARRRRDPGRVSASRFRVRRRRAAHSIASLTSASSRVLAPPTRLLARR
jgi:hypothetical protein